MSDLPPLPFETPASEEDLAVMRDQLGRDMRGVVSVARRCACGRPAVVRTAPRLEDGTPFPTSLYLTLPSIVAAVSRLEAAGRLAELTEQLAHDEQLAAGQQRAHELYLARRAELGEVPEIAGISAGGLPGRVKCLHALVGHALAEGPGADPVGDLALAEIADQVSIDVCRCEDADRPAGEPGTGPVAALDCGTNSIRLLIARPAPATGALLDVERRMEIVRLGYGVDRTGAFDPGALARTLDATRRYGRLIAHHGAHPVRFVATSATRDARNRQELIDGVRGILGVDPEVISGAEEAELSFRGAVSTIGDLPEGPRLVVDIGGGSTELVLGTEHPEHRISLDMGSVRLTERHLRSDPPTEAEIAAARADVDALLDRAAQEIPLARTRALVGVAGTVTTLTAIAEHLPRYSPEVTHGLRQDISRTIDECERILRADRPARAAEPALHPGRVDVIGAGALIWERVLERVREASGVQESFTSEHDILDGIALALLEA